MQGRNSATPRRLAGRAQKALALAGLGTLLLGTIATGAVANPNSTSAADFADAAFQRTWARTDQLVAGGQVERSWYWGPGPDSGALQEDYAEGEGGKRLVQYFDKSRMEINDPTADKSSPFYVTNGLLTVELISGRIQVGNDKYTTSYSAAINMAGDPGDTKSPTYAAFAGVSNTPLGDHKQQDKTGQTIVSSIDVHGRVFTDTTTPQIKYAQFVSQTGHNIAEPFWQFLNLSGPVINGATTTTAPLSSPWFYASGYPISDPYWAKMTVDGKVLDVLIQAFERRVLTYTPTNPAGFQVEMGNIGQHYYDWRYTGAGTGKPTPTIPPTATPAPPAPTPTAIRTGGGPVTLNGAGATFPAPIYTKWFQYYSNNIEPNVSFNYQPIGSGAGISQITAKTVDFGASDAPLTDAQLQAAPGLILVPMVAGNIVVAYNVPGFSGQLTLDGTTLADIFLGNIDNWSDPEIKALNPNANLPNADIVVVHRSDGSGTTYHFTDYLSAVSPDWKSQVGHSTSVNWPVGLGGRGNAGVAGLVQQTPGAIGYIEIAYAKQNNIQYALMKNKAGQVVDATLDALQAAVNGAVPSVPDDLRVSIVNSPDPAAWPIAGFTYILIYQNQTDQNKGQALVNYLWWALHDSTAASQARDLLYMPMPASLLPKVEARLRLVNYNGKQLAP